MFEYKYSVCPRCGFVRISGIQDKKCSFCGYNNVKIDFTQKEINKIDSLQDGDIPGGKNDWLRENFVFGSSQFDESLYSKMLKQKPKPKSEEYVPPVTYTPPQVKCPYCGSTQIQMVPRRWSILTGFLTNKVDRVCCNCKRRF